MRLDLPASARLGWFTCLLFLVTQAAVGADAQDYTVQVTPASVEIPQGREATVLVLLQNGGSGTLENPRVTTFGNPPLQVEIERKEIKSVLPHGAVAWMARLATNGMNAVTGSVYFRVDFVRRPTGDETNSIPIATIAPLAVTSQNPQPLSEVVEIKVETTVESLNEKRPGTVHLVINSKVNTPVTVHRVRITGPDYLTIQPVETDPGPQAGERGVADANLNPPWLSLAPFESRVVAYKVAANSQVTPGKQFLAFEVPLTWERSGYRQSGVVVATQQIEVGIFGESAILAALGIPTFLFLPGFLMLAAFGLLSKFGKSDAERESYFLKANTPDFYIVSITLSMLAFAAYPFLTKVFTGVSRDFLGAYGLADVVAVWFGSVILGVLAFGIVRIATYVFQQIKRQRLLAHQFSTTDAPLAFLRKLALREGGIVLGRVKVTVGSNTVAAFSLEEAESRKWWVAPSIAMKWSETKAPNPDEKAITTAIDKEESITAIIELLEGAIKRHNVELEWLPAGPVAKLQTVDQSSLGEPVDKQSILETV